MIESLSIHNYALIDRAEIGMENGFSVITGETGAGKSILLGALGLTLGQRADSSAIMDKEKKCVVEIVYRVDDYRLQGWFEENELDYSDTVLVRREISADGRSRCFINDTPVNGKLLKEFGQFVIDIHSQHQSLLIGRPDFQFDMLDALGRNQEQVSAYKKLYRQRRLQLERLEQLQEQVVVAFREEEYLKFQLAQLESASLKRGEQEELEEELKLLTNAEAVQSGFYRLTQQLRDSEYSVLSVLQQCRSVCTALREVVREAGEYEERLHSATLELNDLAEEAGRRAETVEYNPARIAFINDRLSVLYDLMRKYKVEDTEALLAVAEEIAGKLAGIQSYADNRAELEAALRKTEEEMRQLAAEITAARSGAGEILRQEIVGLLQELGIKHARFEVGLKSSGEFLPNGTDEVSFLFAANKNQEPGDISRVASGGEISRVMLVLKYVLSRTRRLPVIVFDEIDTGLSGEVAHKMAKMMREMAEGMQVISISHLPQIAAGSTVHYKVYKEDNFRHTISKIRKLSEEERVQEIAGMISGSEISEAALAAARNLLAQG